jgi:hypothetical protein
MTAALRAYGPTTTNGSIANRKSAIPAPRIASLLSPVLPSAAAGGGPPISFFAKRTQKPRFQPSQAGLFAKTNPIRTPIEPIRWRFLSNRTQIEPILDRPRTHGRGVAVLRALSRPTPHE